MVKSPAIVMVAPVMSEPEESSGDDGSGDYEETDDHGSISEEGSSSRARHNPRKRRRGSVSYVSQQTSRLRPMKTMPSLDSIPVIAVPC